MPFVSIFIFPSRKKPNPGDKDGLHMIAWSCADGDNVIVVHERVERVDIAGDWFPGNTCAGVNWLKSFFFC